MRFEEKLTLLYVEHYKQLLDMCLGIAYYTSKLW